MSHNQRKTSWLRKLIWTAGFALAGLLLLVLFLWINPGGWGARILARIGIVYNPPVVVSPPPGFVPQAPPGFKVSVFASDFKMPRWLATAPSGDIFVADSEPGRIVVLQDPNRRGQAETRFTFAEN